MSDDTETFSEFPCPRCRRLYSEKTGYPLSVVILEAQRFSHRLCSECIKEVRPEGE